MYWGEFMKKKCKTNRLAGFTLLELLIAATIIGILALFATVGYRNSMAEARVAEGRAKVKALAIANYRAHIDYPGISFGNDAISDTVSVVGGSGDVCKRGFAYAPTETWAASCLVANGYVDAMGFGGYFQFKVKGDSEACMYGANSKLGSKYNGKEIYCYDAETDKDTVNL